MSDCDRVLIDLIDILPRDILAYIIHFLPPKDVLDLIRVSPKARRDL